MMRRQVRQEGTVGEGVAPVEVPPHHGEGRVGHAHDPQQAERRQRAHVLQQAQRQQHGKSHGKERMTAAHRVSRARVQILERVGQNHGIRQYRARRHRRARQGGHPTRGRSDRPFPRLPVTPRPGISAHPSDEAEAVSAHETDETDERRRGKERRRGIPERGDSRRQSEDAGSDDRFHQVEYFRGHRGRAVGGGARRDGYRSLGDGGGGFLGGADAAAAAAGKIV
mmetsp:Transcript_4754/g.13436  ORF Transcript_4754/g.13436 Transcript_4754/m.13436 type:complete len:225 (+) Transcript_4754:1269-1943(+)